jgi:phosphatidylglycerol:prolipoprotein diacylglycerol transferase
MASYVLILGFLHFSKREPLLFAGLSRLNVAVFHFGAAVAVVLGAWGLAALQGLSQGFAFYGGLLGFSVFAFLYARTQKISFIEILNRVASPLALAHAVGRIGCFLAGCCYGTHCELPWAVHNDIVGDNLHPVQLYESAALAVLGIFLWKHETRRLRGEVSSPSAGIYLVMYAILRFVLEFFRGDATRGAWGPLSTSQWISLVLVVFGSWLSRKSSHQRVLS